MADHWKFFLGVGGVARSDCAKNLLRQLVVLALFCGVFRMFLVGDSVWAILGVLSGLKRNFGGEIKCRFLGFWIAKERMEGQ